MASGVGKGLLCQAPLHLLWLVGVPTGMDKSHQPECLWSSSAAWLLHSHTQTALNWLSWRIFISTLCRMGDSLPISTKILHSEILSSLTLCSLHQNKI